MRAALETGDIELAGALLGHRWFVTAEVQPRREASASSDFRPPIFAFGASCRLRHGIYAVRVLVDGRVRDGVASFGRRPTFAMARRFSRCFSSISKAIFTEGS